MFHRPWTVALAALAPAALLSASLSAGEAAADERPAAAREHEGFSMRFLLGPAILAAAASDQGEDIALSGPGATLHVQLGYNILPRLILYGEVFDDLAFGPKLEIGDEEQDVDDVTLAADGFAAGLSYYFRNNIYLAGSAAITRLRTSVGPGGDESDFGFGVNLLVGGEWWVSDTWALGPAAKILIGRASGELDDAWGFASIAFGLSATYD
jgi:hypothetical protein